jgi:hypothetical protein
MMQCPQCQTSNRLGAIFCRSCGAKLEIDSITSQTFEQATGVVPQDKIKAKKRVRRIIVNSLRLVFLAAVVFGVYLALQRPAVEQPETRDEYAKAFTERRDKLLNALERQNKVENVEFSTIGVNSSLARMMAATENKGKTFQLVDSWAVFGEDGQVTWVIDAKLFGRLLRFQYMGTAEVKEGKLVFTPEGLFSGKLGQLPYPTYFMKTMTKRLWDSILEDGGGANKKLLGAISALKFEKDKVIITVTK